jgi:saccharopine dehydrogenase-like NADP-dependent oxidoreductase
MKVLVLGCGEMGRVAVADLLRYGQLFRTVGIVTRHPERVEEFLATARDRRRAVIHRGDVQDEAGLVALMRGYDVVCNLAGPNYLNAVPAVRAAIAAGVHLVDVSDDWEATLAILDLHGAAVQAGVTIVVGLGASPGVTNVLARAGADRLDRVEEVRTAWVMRGSDMGGPALSMHLLYSLPHRAFVFEDGAMREVRPFVDGRETLDFPELGPVEVTHIGHPEPFTLSRYIPGVRYADDKATFLPVEVARMIVELGPLARSRHPVAEGDARVDPMAFAAGYLHQTCGRLDGVPTTAALRTEVRGQLAGRPTRIVYTASGRIGIGTGVPASIGACLLGLGKLARPGVYPPEACIDPEWFLLAVSMRELGDVHEAVLPWEREERRPMVAVPG